MPTGVHEVRGDVVGDFSGIGPAALKKMIGAFDGDRTHLRGRGSYCRGQFAQHGLGTEVFGEMLGICGWLDDESPKLKRRANLAAAMDAGAGPGARVVQIPESVTETYAQADGKKLAQQFNENDGGDSKAGDGYRALAQELLTHQDDPDANLTPSEATTLPTLLASTRGKTADTDLTVFSHALGTAPRARYPALGFDKVVTGFTTPVPKGAGTFPSDFLAKSTRANGLDRFADDHSMHLQGDPFVAQALGLPQNTTTLDLDALSTDEAATQQAFATMGQDGGKTDPNGNLKALAGYAHDPELTAAFQATLDAGAGNRPAQGPYGSYCAPVLQEKPTGQTWCRGGKVTLRTSEDWTQFDRWARSGALTDQQWSLLRNLTSDASAGYDDGTMWRTPGTVAVE